MTASPQPGNRDEQQEAHLAELRAQDGPGAPCPTCRTWPTYNGVFDTTVRCTGCFQATGECTCLAAAADQPGTGGEADDGTTPDAELRAWKPNTEGTGAPWRAGDCAGHEPDGHRTRWCYCRRNALRYPMIPRTEASSAAEFRPAPLAGQDTGAATGRDRDGPLRQLIAERDDLRRERDEARGQVQRVRKVLNGPDEYAGPDEALNDVRRALGPS